MAVERADLSSSLSLEQTLPVAAAPAGQGKTSPDGGQAKPRRRPPVEKTSTELVEEELDQRLNQDDPDRPPHRIDSLA